MCVCVGVVTPLISAGIDSVLLNTRLAEGDWDNKDEDVGTEDTDGDCGGGDAAKSCG